jgi:transposase
MDLLGLDSVKAVSSETRDGVLFVAAEIEGRASSCLICNAADPYLHDTREQEFVDSPIRGEPVRIALQRQRYRCRACKKTFFQPIAALSSKRNMTRRAVHHIATESLIRTFTDVARSYAVDVQTVRGVFMDFSDWLRENHPIATPRVMGIDEAKRAKVLCTVLTNLEKREYFDMLPTRQKKPLNSYLANLEDKDLVRVVAMDLHLGFVTAIARNLPAAIRVADRYHVARLAQEAFEKAHVATRKTLPQGERLAMFRKRPLLAERARSLSAKQKDAVEKTLEPFPILQAAYQAKEDFLCIYDARDRVAAEVELDAWMANLPAELRGFFRAVTSAVSVSRELILNYFDHRYTNAFTEAANGISKLLQKTGRGYGFEVMRVKLLYGKRARAIDVSSLDAGSPTPPQMMGRATGSMALSFAALTETDDERKARGPSVEKVSALIDEGYYDLGNDAIAKEMQPMIRQFSRVA